MRYLSSEPFGCSDGLVSAVNWTTLILGVSLNLNMNTKEVRTLAGAFQGGTKKQSNLKYEYGFQSRAPFTDVQQPRLKLSKRK